MQNVAECVRKLRTDFGRREVSLAPYVRYLVCKCKKLAFSSINQSESEKAKTVWTPKNITAVAESLREALSTSIRGGSQQLNIRRHHGDKFCIKALV